MEALRENTSEELAVTDISSLETNPSLLRRLRNTDDASAWRAFSTRYQRPLYGWCLAWFKARCPDAQCEADDTVQEILIGLLKSMRRFEYDPSKSFRAWLKTVATNACRDACRNRRAIATAPLGLDVLETHEAEIDLMERLQKTFDLEVFEEACQRVQLRILKNPQGNPKTWEAFCLTVSPALGGEGLATSEAASRLETTSDFVATACKNIKKMLEQEIALLDPENGK